MRALAPGLFSMNTDCPSFCCITGASLRAMMSVAPPGVKGTTIRIGRDGKFATGSAPAAAAPTSRQPTTATSRPVTCSRCCLLGRRCASLVRSLVMSIPSTRVRTFHVTLSARAKYCVRYCNGPCRNKPRLFLIRSNAFTGFDRAYRTRDHVRWAGKDTTDQTLDLLAPHECGFEILLFGVGEKFGVLHHGFERLTKYRHALQRGAGWRYDRIGHVLPRADQFQHAPIGVVFGEIRHQRRRIHARMPLQPELHDHVDLFVRNPLRPAGEDPTPRDTGSAVGFLALDCQEEVRSAGITGHDLHLGSQHAVEDVGEDATVGPGAGAGYNHFILPEIVDRLERPSVPGQHEAHVR